MDQSTTPTLEDVARAAGVSTATVSRCLNMPDKVVAATRERVMIAVRDLGYSPNFGARVLAAKRTNTIGAVIPTMENSIFALGLQAFQEELQAQGRTLLVASSAYDPELEDRQIRALVARGADALLLIGHDRDAAIYGFLDRQNVPYVVTWAHDPTEKVCSVGFDNLAGMRDMAKVVLALGHQRVGVISAPMAGNDRARLRVAGIRAALDGVGLPPEAMQVVEAPYSIDAAAMATRSLLDASPRPTVIMCGNDVQAAGVVRQVKSMGLRVPHDVSVTGFDDMELARVVDPAITTVAVAHPEMGRLAARHLIAMVNGETPPRSSEVATRIVHRASLAHPSNVAPD